ncbi:MAG: undecaprenyl-diphosphate phosphatase [Lentisphaerae bacterium]|jgi:undecaprenyl-diphosphatase|nr:undecaprenyl-diphosphate phosphatase [Lentisphaerota bacterium]
MSFLEICGLAIMQGLTEFLPVSSSGHLLLLQHFAGMKASPGPALELALHGGTLLSILVFYRKRLLALLSGALRREKVSLLYCAALLVSCIPAAIVYFLFKEPIENLFDEPLICSVMLMVTGLLLLSTRFLPRSGNVSSPGFLHATGIGLIQAVALLPGISRSGSTITCARWLGIAPQKAAEFSFLMSIPLLAGGILLKAKDIFAMSDSPGELAVMLTGCSLAAIIGFLSLKILALFQISGKFWYFGCYCLTVGGVAALVILFG